MFAEALLKITTEAVSSSVQTTDEVLEGLEECSVVEKISEAAAQLCSYERSFLLIFGCKYMKTTKLKYSFCSTKK